MNRQRFPPNILNYSSRCSVIFSKAVTLSRAAIPGPLVH
jgi:hypothetical protein